MIFLTILSIAFGVLSFIRIVGVITNNDPEAQKLVELAERLGGNPIYDAVKIPLLIFTVCLCYWISLLF